MRITPFFLSLLLAIFAKPVVAQEGLEASLTTTWESLYFSEGRDSLNGNSLTSTNLDLSYERLAVGAWYAESIGNSYRELNLFAETQFDLGPFSSYLGYTYLQFINDEGEDHEISIGLAYEDLPYDLTASIDGYYSLFADGFYWIASVSTEWSLEEDWLTFAPVIELGANQNYYQSGHDGVDHLSCRIDAQYCLAQGCELAMFAAYSWAINDDVIRYADDAGLNDFFFFGLGCTFSFL